MGGVNQVLRPALRYYGGKWMLGHSIAATFPPHRIYVEPFGGAASVLLQKPRSRHECYNDLSGEVVAMFRAIRDCDSDLARLLYWTPFSRAEFLESKQEASQFLEQARRTIVRSFQSYGAGGQRSAGFRTPKLGGSNTSPAMDFTKLAENVMAIAERMRGVVIEQMDAVDLIQVQDSKETLFYVDPPYPHDTRGDDDVYDHEMTEDQHGYLLAVLSGIEGMAVVSGYRCELYDHWLQDCPRVDLKAKAMSNGQRVESLWFINCEPPQSTLFD